MAHGIAGQRAPELTVPYWIDAEGQQRTPLTLLELGSRYRVLFFYQHWCDGCHSHGFPTLCSLISRLNGKDVGFAAIQTAFEGIYVNTIDKLQTDRQRYGLKIPFGHEGRSVFGEQPTTMDSYRTAGTPWFVAIAPSGLVLQDGFTIRDDEFVASIDGSRSIDRT
jgi:hypothetical protein